MNILCIMIGLFINNFQKSTSLQLDYYKNKCISKLNKLDFLNKRSFIDVLNKSNHLIYDNITENKKLISISPGGIKGFYLMGTINYIKENYNLDDYIFSGASAGAWSGLFMSLKYPNADKDKETTDNYFIRNIILDDNLKKAKTLLEFQYMLKYKILSLYTNEDFELDKLFIGVTSIKNFRIQTSIFSRFENVEDAINCCIASSHIPFITGGIINKYHDIYTFDGGFSKYPYLNFTNATLHISPDMWVKKNKNFDPFSIAEYTTLFSKDKYNFYELYENGYNDAKKNKDYLDSIFIQKKIL